MYEITKAGIDFISPVPFTSEALELAMQELSKPQVHALSDFEKFLWASGKPELQRQAIEIAWARVRQEASVQLNEREELLIKFNVVSREDVIKFRRDQVKFNPGIPTLLPAQESRSQ
jgi:hypothetical protein